MSRIRQKKGLDHTDLGLCFMIFVVGTCRKPFADLFPSEKAAIIRAEESIQVTALKYHEQ